MLADIKGGVAGGLTQVASLGSGKGGIPFAIEGTTSNPHFIPDMKRRHRARRIGRREGRNKGKPGECNQRPAGKKAEMKCAAVRIAPQLTSVRADAEHIVNFGNVK
jgi:hypothetical protein